MEVMSEKKIADFEKALQLLIDLRGNETFWTAIPQQARALIITLERLASLGIQSHRTSDPSDDVTESTES